MTANEKLRRLPSVDEVLQQLDGTYPRDLATREVRRAIDEMRATLLAGGEADPESVSAQVAGRLERLARPSLRRLINATGVVLHTNLGRAPLPAALNTAYGYSNLEYDLATGRRGKRDVHVACLLEALTGAPGIVVNNGAAAVWLVLHELAAGGEVIISRGELIEIGDGFRIPEIMVRSGAILREVGTTNRTHLEDYRSAINERTRLILRVHPSNFQITGFTSKPSLDELAALAHEHNVPLYEDLGSGCMVDLKPYGIDEPTVRESLASGVDLVSFSGDKLLGGPQAGIISGSKALVTRVRRNPMFRALRVDKLTYSALEVTLRRILLDPVTAVPALAMIAATEPEIRARAVRVQAAVGGVLGEGLSVIGGGSTPSQSLPTCLLIFERGAADLDARLRAGEPPVVGRIEKDRLLIDLRTVLPGEDVDLTHALLRALGHARSSDS